MFIVISFVIITTITLIAIWKSKKPIKLILAEAKYELLYNVVGSKALLQDMIMKKNNKTELPLKSGKIAVITGGSRGIGMEVVKMLLKCDIHVIIGCRNVRAAELLLNNAREEGIKTGQSSVFQLDISVIESVKNFAANLKEHFPKIHYLINNAGIMFGPYIETRDGFESQFSTNYLGHFLLTHLLLPELKAGGEDKNNARIINVSSCAHLMGDINFADINNREQYIPGKVYSQSKLAQVLFTNYLDALLKKESSRVQVHSVHPGIVNTEIFDGTTLKNLVPWVPNLFFKTPVQGAIPIIHACLSSELEGKGGTYIHNCKIFSTSDSGNDIELQEKLFNFTKEMLKINEFGKP